MFDLNTIVRRNEAAESSCAKCGTRGEVKPNLIYTVDGQKLRLDATCANDLVNDGCEVVIDAAA